MRKHFHTFDALRFFSFLLVFFHHVPHIDTTLISFFSKSGGVGVTFFFVLSGFLITYILLHEKVSNGRISLKRFFIRRVLRIWPLFYAMILFAFATPYLLQLFQFSYSSEGYAPNWLMSVLFLENYRMMLTNSFPNVAPLRVMWSLCIEEHFYILWGIALSYFSINKVPHLIFYSIVFSSVLRIIYGYYGVATMDIFTNLDYFAFGAVPAYILISKPDILTKIEKISISIKYTFVFFTLAFIFVIPHIEVYYLDFVTPLLYGFFFATVISFTLCNKNAIRISDGYWISKLGVYTYGLYLFHTIVINFLLRIKHLLLFELNETRLLIIALVCTILISIASYHLFEKQFLKLKRVAS